MAKEKVVKQKTVKGVYAHKYTDGTMVYRVHVWADDIDNVGKKKTYVRMRTWHPDNLSPREIEAYQLEIKVDCIKEIRELVVNAAIQRIKTEVNKDILFLDYARNNWLPFIKPPAYKPTYYERGKDTLDKFEKYLKGIKLVDIDRKLLQKAFDDLCRKEIGVSYAKIRNQSIKLFEEGYGNVKKFCQLTGLTKTTLQMVRKGKRVSIDTAEKICAALGVKVHKYFEVFDETKYYSKHTVHGYFRILRTILGQAYSQDGLIERNPLYGQKVIQIKLEDKTDAVTEDMIFNPKECEQLESICLSNIRRIMEQYEANKSEADYWNIRQYVMFLIGLHTGARNGELVGLQWKDIDFDNRTLRIVRNAVYTKSGGVRVGEPKTKYSKRIIKMSNMLTENLRLYKKWWDRENEIFQVKDKFLFIQQGGEMIHPCTPSGWLDKVLKVNGIKHLGMHGLRHTFASISIVVKKQDIVSVSKALGHVSAEFTLKVYTHIIAQGIDALADAWDSGW